MKSTLNSPFFDTNQLLACRLVCAVGKQGKGSIRPVLLLATKCIANAEHIKRFFAKNNNYEIYPTQGRE